MRTLFLLLIGVVLAGCETHRPIGDDLKVQLNAPLAGAGTGSPFSPVAGKPTFRWTTSPAAQTFQVQVDDSCDLSTPCPFPSPEIDESGLTTMSFTPAVALAVPSAAPRRQRYHWRVRACRGEDCGEWSAARYFVVGQDLALNRDLNGDGFADFLVGAPNSSVHLTQTGQAYVYLGGPTLPKHPALVINSDIPLDGLGRSVAMAGDVNGDGFGDFLVRTNGNDTNIGTEKGRILLFYGGAVLKDQPDITFVGGHVADYNGSEVGCGDLNGDGYDDIAFAAADVDALHNSIPPARVEIHFGGPTMTTAQPLVLFGETPSVGWDFFGSSLSAGDVNGDGYADLIVGAYHGDNGSGRFSGRVRIYFGGPQMDATPDVILDNPADIGGPNMFGYAVAGVGDINGDGFADVAVGAMDGDEYPAPVGRVYVYYGGTSPHTTPALILEGNYPAEYFGHAVVSAGDLNHDGYADMAVMARGLAGIDADPNLGRSVTPGKTFLYLGGESPSLSPFASASAESSFPTNFRLAVFDIDGDAEPEILTGQIANYASSPQSGQVAIYQSRDNYASPARTLSAPSSDDWFGIGLSR